MRAVWYLLVNDAAEPREVQQKQQHRRDDDSKDEQDPGSANMHRSELWCPHRTDAMQFPIQLAARALHPSNKLVSMATPSVRSPQEAGRKPGAGERARDFWQRVTEGMELNQLWSQF